MKVIIIDDEKKARNVIHTLLDEYCPRVSAVYEAADLLSGVALIKKENPDLVLLDIQMPEYSGLEILDFIDKKDFNFEIIFITAYSEYAIQAFQLSAIDYLLKPIKPQQLKDAVEKAYLQKENSQISLKIDQLRKNLQASNFKKIGLPYADGLKFVNIADLVSFEADGMYTKVSILNEPDFLVSKPLKFFVDNLKDNSLFYRTHRSHLINLKFIQEYIKKDGGYIVMENDKNVSISKDKKEEFITLISSI